MNFAANALARLSHSVGSLYVLRGSRISAWAPSAVTGISKSKYGIFLVLPLRMLPERMSSIMAPVGNAASVPAGIDQVDTSAVSTGLSC